jgi:hypothetical protein
MALPVAVVALCISAGVHAALAAMHIGAPDAFAEFAVFDLSAVLSVICILAVESGRRRGSLFAAVVLATFAGVYIASRVVAVPMFGQLPPDALGTITASIELIGAYAAMRVGQGPPVEQRAAPRAVCTLIIAYCFLASFAIPTNHHDSIHSGGHSHASQS